MMLGINKTKNHLKNTSNKQLYTINQSKINCRNECPETIKKLALTRNQKLALRPDVDDEIQNRPVDKFPKTSRFKTRTTRSVNRTQYLQTTYSCSKKPETFIVVAFFFWFNKLCTWSCPVIDADISF